MNNITMVNVLTQKPGDSKLSILDSAIVSISKVGVDFVSPMTLDKLTGGNPLFNSMGKFVTAGLLGGMVKGKNGSLISTGLVVSATEDLLSLVMPKKNANATSNGNTQDIASQGNDAFGQANLDNSIQEFI